MTHHGSRTPISRREVLRLAAAVGVGVPLLQSRRVAAGSEAGDVTFFSTQFNNVEEAERFRDILGEAYEGNVEFIPGDAGQLATQIRAQVEAERVEINLIGGIHGDLAPLAADGLLEDLGDVMESLADRGYSEDFLELAKAGGESTIYIPWMQATYIVAVHNDALDSLPSGADVNALTYDQFLEWAIAAREANDGRAVFGLPGGPNGLLHRFIQGYLYPSFTGGQISTFTSPEAVTMWEYFRELWANCVSASANYEFMQEPLASGEVLVGWDHVARLIEAPRDQPDAWTFVPAPSGPEGLGYMAILAGVAIPRGAPDQDAAKALITALAEPETQLEVLSQNAFFPVVDAEIGEDLPPEILLEATAVEATQSADNALTALPPVGLGENDAQMSKAFRDAFTAIVLQEGDIESALEQQAEVIQGLLDEAEAACWAPDPASDGVCQVG
jgi:multiple sugar transport system substrate-binding protein